MRLGVCVDDDVRRLRRDVWHVLADGMRRGVCLRGRVCSARRVYLQRWLRVHIDYYNRLRWSVEHERGTNEHTEHVCDMPGGARLCRRGVATDILFLQPRVLLTRGRHSIV
jgi:hypothetical protein